MVGIGKSVIGSGFTGPIFTYYGAANGITKTFGDQGKGAIRLVAEGPLNPPASDRTKAYVEAFKAKNPEFDITQARITNAVEMLAKAAYEETFGRIATLIRGGDHSGLARLSAEQARAYATFLQQVPWYKWDFLGDALALDVAATDAMRDRERQFALGIEYRVKSGYAEVIAGAVEGVGGDALTLRMIVDAYDAPSDEAITVIGKRPEGVELETIRYRALTRILLEMAAQGVNFVEIAGNDDIMLTVLSDQAAMEGAQSSMQRQGYEDYRHLVGVKVHDLAETLREYASTGISVEHIHDY